MKKKNTEERTRLSKIIKKAAKKDREQFNINMLEEITDEKEGWKIIRYLNRTYKPKPNTIQDKSGRK